MHGSVTLNHPYCTPPAPHLWDDDVSQSSRQSEQFQGVLEAEGGVVDDVVLDAVVNVGDFTDVVAAVLHAEVSL